MASKQEVCSNIWWSDGTNPDNGCWVCQKIFAANLAFRDCKFRHEVSGFSFNYGAMVIYYYSPSFSFFLRTLYFSPRSPVPSVVLVLQFFYLSCLLYWFRRLLRKRRRFLAAIISGPLSDCVKSFAFLMYTTVVAAILLVAWLAVQE